MCSVQHRSTAWWESRGKMQSEEEHQSTAGWESRGKVQKVTVPPGGRAAGRA